MKQKRLAGFINHELLTALFVVNILYWIGYGVAKGLGLHGKQSLIPHAITVGCFLAYIIGLNLKEVIGRRKKNLANTPSLGTSLARRPRRVTFARKEKMKQ